MDKRVTGTLLGIASVLLWFMPWTQFSMGEFELYRNGSHIGGLAYVLLISSLAYTVLAWVTPSAPRIIAASLSVLLSGLFLLNAGNMAAWGLVCLCVVSILTLLQAIARSHTTTPSKPVD